MQNVCGFFNTLELSHCVWPVFSNCRQIYLNMRGQQQSYKRSGLNVCYFMRTVTHVAYVSVFVIVTNALCGEKTGCKMTSIKKWKPKRSCDHEHQLSGCTACHRAELTSYYSATGRQCIDWRRVVVYSMIQAKCHVGEQDAWLLIIYDKVSESSLSIVRHTVMSPVPASVPLFIRIQI